MAFKSGIRLSPVFEHALLFSLRAHEGQFRKGNRAPYFSHPMAVSSLVMEYGGSEEQAIAALLHDTIEDCDVSASELEMEFGRVITKLVTDCTEPLSELGDHSWQERKEAYLAQVAQLSEESLLIVLCDKYHNLHSLWRDLQLRGNVAWKIFREPQTKLQWYYSELESIFRKPDALREMRARGLLETFSNLSQAVFHSPKN